MTQGQLRQWLSDNVATTRPGWLKLVAAADTVKKLTRLWSCRHDDGSSDYNWGIPLEHYEPSGRCFLVFDHKWLEKNSGRKLLYENESRTFGMDLGSAVNGVCPAPPSWIADAGTSKLLHEQDVHNGYVYEGRTLDCPDWK